MKTNNRHQETKPGNIVDRDLKVEHLTTDKGSKLDATIFNLSKKIRNSIHLDFDVDIIKVQDVKEFIKQLKMNLAGFGEYHGVEVFKIIDKLSGDKLCQ